MEGLFCTCWMLESWYEEAREKLIVVLKSVETKV